jgi:hypothetical protein
MGVLRDGTFDFTIDAKDLSRGLRPSKRMPRDSKFLIKCVGAVGLDTVLQAIDDLENDRIDTSLLGASFPYPQIFIFVNYILVCTATDIYEWDGISLTKVLGPVSSGELWSAVDLHNFIYMSNGTVAVLRDSETGTYSTTSDQPKARAMCNFNGQIILGSPEE